MISRLARSVARLQIIVNTNRITNQQIPIAADLPKSYDVMIASNVVEHFKDPISILGKIINNTEKIAIIMLPFKEDTSHLVSEHTKSFNFN